MQPAVVILDLDGVVYIGPDAVAHAIPALNALAERGTRLTAATNNASRPATEVAEHLQRLGLRIAADDVMTSSQAAAEYLAGELPPDSPVLAVGGVGVSLALEAVGLRALRASSDLSHCDAVATQAVAVVMGFGPLVGWSDLTAAKWAIERGARWIATNTDPSVPQLYGTAPGNGAFVQLMRNVTGHEPEVIGKPKPTLFQAIVRRTGGVDALVIGDRLDTDIDGARAAGLPSLLVFTGVQGPRDLAQQPLAGWPDFVARDLRSLDGPPVPLHEADPSDPVVQAVRAAADRARGGGNPVPERAAGEGPSPLIDLRALR